MDLSKVKRMGKEMELYDLSFPVARIIFFNLDLAFTFVPFCIFSNYN